MSQQLNRFTVCCNESWICISLSTLPPNLSDDLLFAGQAVYKQVLLLGRQGAQVLQHDSTATREGSNMACGECVSVVYTRASAAAVTFRCTARGNILQPQRTVCA